MLRNFSTRCTQDDGRKSSVYLLIVSSPLIFFTFIALIRSDNNVYVEDDDPFGYQVERDKRD